MDGFDAHRLISVELDPSTLDRTDLLAIQAAYVAIKAKAEAAMRDRCEAFNIAAYWKDMYEHEARHLHVALERADLADEQNAALRTQVVGLGAMPVLTTPPWSHALPSPPLVPVDPCDTGITCDSPGITEIDW